MQIRSHARAVVLDLVARFRRQRPLRGGSLIVTIFGDCIMPRGGAVSLSSLIRLAAVFGLGERLVRTAAARLAHDGWVETRRSGKLSEYRLSSDGRVRFAEATERIYGEATAPWTGTWTLVLMPAMRAAQRRRLRTELAWRGFGELASGVFAHPETMANDVAAKTAALGLPPGTLVFDADLARTQDPGTLVRLGWDLADLGKRYARFVRRFEPALRALQQGAVDPEIAFVLRTLLIHEYRRLHLRDPLLPRRLLPGHWPGIRAAELCREIYLRVFGPSEHHLSSEATRLDGMLPPPDAEVMRRFGGLGGPLTGAGRRSISPVREPPPA
jgi:phenylacetic acid degradation operon negative regulatory protein